MNSLQQLGYFAFQFIQRNKGLFAVVAANDDALVLFDVLWTDLQTQRNTLHLILTEFPTRTLVCKVGFYSCNFFKSFCNFLSLFDYAFFMHSYRNNHNLCRCNTRRNNKTAVVTVNHY